MRYAALLRGVNVGKSVKVPMASLRALVEGAGFRNVVTYLNSGNVLFDSDLPPAEISSSLAKLLADFSGQQIPVLVKSSLELSRIQAAIPTTWQNNDSQKTDVAYLFEEADTEATLDLLPIRRDFLDVRYVQGALLWNVSRQNYDKSHLNKLVSHALYQQMTVRNVNTARQLALLATQRIPQQS